MGQVLGVHGCGYVGVSALRECAAGGCVRRVCG